MSEMKPDMERVSGQTNSEAEERPGWMRRQNNAGKIALIVLIVALVVFFILYNFTGFKDVIGNIGRIFQPIVFGIGMAYIINPIMRIVEERSLKKQFAKGRDDAKAKKRARSVGILVAELVLIGAIIAVVLLIVPQIVTSTQTIVESMPEYIKGVTAWYEGIKNDDGVGSYLASGIDAAVNAIQNWFETNVVNKFDDILVAVTSGVMNVAVTALNFIIGIAVSIYVLSTKDGMKAQLKKCIYSAMKPVKANWLINTFRKSDLIFGGFIKGKIVDSIIIGLICFGGCLLLQIPYAVLIGVVVGITNVIPFFGPFIGAIPSALLVFMVDPMKCIVFVIFILILQQVDGNIIGPKILGNNIGLSMFWVLFAILIFGGFFGILGVILGCPVFGVIYYIVKEWQRVRLVKRGLPYAPEEFEDLYEINAETKELVYHERYGYRRKAVDLTDERSKELREKDGSK